MDSFKQEKSKSAEELNETKNFANELKEIFQLEIAAKMMAEG